MLGLGALGQYPLGAGPFGSATITTINWFMPLADPVRLRPRSPAAIAPWFFYQPAPSPFVATGWYSPLSTPVRFKPGLAASLQQFLASPDPLPRVSFSWFGELSKPPKLTKAGLNPSEQQFTAYQANPTTVTPFAWFVGLSEPPRFKPGLKAALQQFETQNPGFIPAPATLIDGWFTWLSEPPRFKPGLKPGQQQFLAYHPRVLPTPNVTVTISAIETNSDKALIAVNVIQSQPAASAVVSIVEVSGGNSFTSVWESS